MTIKNLNHDQLAKLRQGADKRTKLTVSRPAKRSIKPVTYEGTGNIRKYVESVVGGRPSAALMQRVENATDFTGLVPDATLIRSWMK